MKRAILGELNDWYNSGTSVPLLVMGPRGVGKTYAVSDFADSLSCGVVYINFETDAYARDYFEEEYRKTVAESDTLAANITAEASDNAKIDIEDAFSGFFGHEGSGSEGNLYIFDEIGACKAFCMLLKAAKIPLSVKILAVSSFIQKEYTEAFKCIYMAPMRFDEFLEGIGKEWYSEIIKGHFERKKAVPQMVHNEILALFEDYLAIGGMPAVVEEYKRNENSRAIASRQREIWTGLVSDIENYGISKGMKDIMEAVVLHLKEERNRFTFNLIRRGVTYKMYADAIDELLFNRLLFGSDNIDNADSFRLMPFDTGLTRYLLTGRCFVSDTVVERQLGLTYLVSCLGTGHRTFYYESDYTAQADLLYTCEEGIVPVDYVTGHRRQIKSINKFTSNHEIAYIVSVGEDNYNIGNDSVKIPIYAAFLLR